MSADLPGPGADSRITLKIGSSSYELTAGVTAAFTTSNATNKVTAEAGEGAEITLTINGEEATNGGNVTWLAGKNTVTVLADGVEYSATVTKE